MTREEFWSYEEETMEEKQDKIANIFLQNIHTVEKEFGIELDYYYDYNKFRSKVEYLQKQAEEYEKQRNKK